MIIHLHTAATRLGSIHLAANGSNLLAVGLPNETAAEFAVRMRRRYHRAEFGPRNRITAMSAIQIAEYLEGRRTTFELPLSLDTTPFQQSVLAAVGRIPYGRTMTYSEVAEAVGAPRAARAVGMANARNPLPLVIPCHRVVSHSGLGGYGGGLKLKQRLLDIEAGT